MLHVALDCFHQVRDQVVPALELDVDLRPGILHLVAQLHQSVEYEDEPQDKYR